ncbi:MAG: alanine racemase, partial [Putridiphycobacter sp.]|nr:alanine racemase [Putridiphycobacter sp.]
MNLNYSISEVAQCINAKIVGKADGMITKVAFDSRSPLNNFQTLFFAFQGSYTHGHDYVDDFIKKGGKMVVVEKELPLKNCTQLIVKNSIDALQLLAKYHRENFNIPVIAITGSNGKTTVKEWLYHVLKHHFSVIRSPKSYNSQIGVPLSVLEITNNHQIAIIEAGISKPGEMERLAHVIQPTIGIYTGIGKAHEQNFTSIEQKEAEKLKLFSKVEKFFDPSNIDAELIQHIPFNNPASVLNASLVKATALYLGLSEEMILKELANLPNISMRMEKMEGSNGNTLINDTYTFDEKGLEIALQSLNNYPHEQRKVLILAPDKNYKQSAALLEILRASPIDELVWIADEKVKLETVNALHHFKTVDTFIQNPLSFKDTIILFAGSRSMQLERCIPLYQLKKHITQLEIDLQAIQHNLQYYRSQLNPNTKILGMVKAQSYGGGSVEMAKFLELENIDALGVAYADEGVLLKKEGVTLPILVMNPEQAAFDDIIDYNLEASIYSLRILDKFISQIILRGKKRIPIHLKLDTGMHRLGFMEEDLNELVDTLNAQPEVYVTAVFSHLAVADNEHENAFTHQQIALFQKMSQRIEDGIGYKFSRHMSNTEGILGFPQANFDMVRIGIGLFGLSSQKSHLQQNALRFKTQLSQIKRIN